MDESELVNKFVSHFQNWFIVEREVWDDSRKGRIDLILTCKQTKVRFGIECKKPDLKRGSGAGKIVMQAVWYSLMKFKGARIPIFIVPELSKTHFVAPIERINLGGGHHIYMDRHHLDTHNHHTFNGFIGEFNIGEVRKIESYSIFHYVFMFLNQEIYSTTKRHFDSDGIIGLHQVNYDKLLVKINSWEDKSGLTLL